MAHAADQTRLILRERWLPLVAELAQRYHWALPGEQLEALVDGVAPHLTQSGVMRPDSATAIVSNYYYDGALVALMRADDANTRESAWMLIEQIVRDLLSAQQDLHASVPTDMQVKRIRSILEKELPHYTFQSSLRMAVARIVGNERRVIDRT